MPAKGSVRKRPPDVQIVSEKIVKQYTKQTGKTGEHFRRIAKALFSQMADYILEDEEGFKLPYNMGILIVNRFTPHSKVIDHRKSAKLGETVYFQNLHSFGDIITTSWIKPDYVKYRNMRAYGFKPHRYIKRAASKLCLAGKIYKKIESRDTYAREMITLDNIQEQYENKLSKKPTP